MGAPLNPVPNVLRVVLEGFVDTSAADTLWANVLHFTYTGSAPTDVQCAAIGTNVANTWNADVASLCPSPTTLQVVTVTDLTSTTAGEGEALVLHPGTRGDDSIPANAAVLISYPSQLRYKGGHPRSYLYVLGNADLQGATNWSTAATAEVQSKWRQFLGDCLNSGSGTATNLSNFCTIRYRGKFLPNGGPPHFYLDTPLINIPPVSTAIAHQQMASQRGRIRRRKA
jgi:hypothetical protein